MVRASPRARAAHRNESATRNARAQRHSPLVELLRPRLLGFLLVGALIFAFAPKHPTREIALARGTIDAMMQAEARRRGVTTLPSADRDEVLARAIDDELLYREGLRLGLDREDPIVRARVVQKMLFHAEDAYGAAAPLTTVEVRAAYDADPTRFGTPATVDLEHVFVAGDPLAAATKEKAAALRVRLTTEIGADPAGLGDAFPLSRRLVERPLREIAALLGEEVAQAATALPIGTWSAPLASSYGLHVVRIEKRKAGAARPFSEVEKDVRALLMLERRRAAGVALIKSLRETWRVRLEGNHGPLPGAAPMDRVDNLGSID